MPFSLSLARISTDYFKGSLEELLLQVKKEEIPIENIDLKEIIQFFKKQRSDFFERAEFLSPFSSLILLKSLHLLPCPPDESDELEEPQESNLEEHIAEYCLFKMAAKELLEIEREQKLLFPRGETPLAPLESKALKLASFSLEDLAKHFRTLLEKASFDRTASEDHDPFDIQTMIEQLKRDLWNKKKVLFNELFTGLASKEEMIALFLALLELLKGGTLQIYQLNQDIYISYADSKTSH